jgi:hypothetical protein
VDSEEDLMTFEDDQKRPDARTEGYQIEDTGPQRRSEEASPRSDGEALMLFE